MCKFFIINQKNRSIDDKADKSIIKRQGKKESELKRHTPQDVVDTKKDLEELADDSEMLDCISKKAVGNNKKVRVNNSSKFFLD